MQPFLFLGFNFLKFWFFEASIGLILYFASVNEAFLKLFSFRLLLSTYFKPWKNEYREGLVGFSILMGMIIKGFTLLFTSLALLLLLIMELIVIVAFILWPIATFVLLFIKY